MERTIRRGPLAYVGKSLCSPLFLARRDPASRTGCPPSRFESAALTSVPRVAARSAKTCGSANHILVTAVESIAQRILALSELAPEGKPPRQRPRMPLSFFGLTFGQPAGQVCVPPGHGKIQPQLVQKKRSSRRRPHPATAHVPLPLHGLERGTQAGVLSQLVR